jgi:hypothetical protein
LAIVRMNQTTSYAGARKKFDAQFALEGKLRDQLENIAERVRNKELQPPLALTEAKKIVDGCVAQAGATGVLGVRLSEFYRQANDIFIARLLDRNRFDLATIVQDADGEQSFGGGIGTGHADSDL